MNGSRRYVSSERWHRSNVLARRRWTQQCYFQLPMAHRGSAPSDGAAMDHPRAGCWHGKVACASDLESKRLRAVGVVKEALSPVVWTEAVMLCCAKQPRRRKTVVCCAHF